MATPTSPTEDALLQRLRAICYEFAGTEEKLSHGAPFFHVRGKGFASFARDHHGDGRVAAWCRASLDEQRRLVASDPNAYFVPPYVGVKGWVGVRLDRPDTDFDALAIVIEEAWRGVVPRSLASAAPSPPPKAPVYPRTDPEHARAALEHLEAACASLPGASVEREGSSATARVAKKPFAYLLDNHHGDGLVAVCVKVPDAEADELLASSPKRYYRPAYIGARGWLALRVDGKRPPWTELARRLAASHAAVTAKRR